MPAKSKLPSWLLDVANRVARLVRTPGNRRIFEARLRAAVPQLRATARSIDHGSDEWTPNVDLMLCNLSRDQQYAWLAAIHDVALPRRRPLLPGRLDGVRGGKLASAPAARAKFRALLPLLALRSMVDELRSRHQECVEEMLVDVERDFTGRPSVTSRPAATEPAEREPRAEGRRADEMTAAEVAEKYDVPKAALSRACRKQPEEPGFLPHRHAGRTVLITRDHAKLWAQNYKARREQRVVGSKSAEGSDLVAKLMKSAKTGDSRRRHKSMN